MNQTYLDTARLLIQIAPSVFSDGTFALKGGTAINLFIEPVELGTLRAARERVVQELQSNLDADERRFRLTLVNGQPEWPLLGIAHAEHLSGIRWKLQNLAQLKRKSPAKFAEQADCWRGVWNKPMRPTRPSSLA